MSPSLPGCAECAYDWAGGLCPGAHPGGRPAGRVTRRPGNTVEYGHPLCVAVRSGPRAGQRLAKFTDRHGVNVKLAGDILS